MTSRMLEETREAPAAVARLMDADAGAYAAFARNLREQPPLSMLTVARGSSDHAAAYLSYLVMARLGRLVASLPMSVITLYQAHLRSEGLVALAFSQSGRSPDLTAPIAAVGAAGARTAAFVNDIQSPLAAAAQWQFALHAGTETSVAATKSYICQLVAGARLVAQWQQDETTLGALRELPSALQRALAQDWTPMIAPLQSRDRLLVIGRGTGLPVAAEAALKLKEVCGIQAEAFSGAELRHGPMALIEDGYPLLVFAPRGPAQADLLALARDMQGRGARVLLAAPEGTPGTVLPLASCGHEDLDPIVAVQSFYQAAEALARARGLDPDHPRHLSKVTHTR